MQLLGQICCGMNHKNHVNINYGSSTRQGILALIAVGGKHTRYPQWDPLLVQVTEAVA